MLNESFFFKIDTLAIQRKHILKSKKAIDELFSNRDRINSQSLTLVFQLKESQPYPFKVGFSVPKRNIRLAYQRNLIKRRLRASFQPLISEMETYANRKQLSIHLMFIYKSKSVLDSVKISEDMRNAVMKCVHCNK